MASDFYTRRNAVRTSYAFSTGTFTDYDGPWMGMGNDIRQGMFGNDGAASGTMRVLLSTPVNASGCVVATNIVANSPQNTMAAQAGGDDKGFEGGVASGDGVLDPADVAQLCLQAIRDEQFLILPHPEVATYVERKATDRDRWLAGMRRFQSALHPDGNLPGNAIAP